MNALYRTLTLAVLASVSLALPTQTFAQENLEVSGWIPYWAASAGAKEATRNIKALDEVNPFAYSVKNDGSLSDTMGLSKSHWKKLFTAAKKEDVRIVPTIMWNDRANIERILMDSSLRAKHVENIAELVEKHGYDGIDIDYENKSAATRPYFSLFLKELDEALGSAFLACTIEARTPPDSVYRVVPATIEYANDFKGINKYCDRVRIMAYDQQTADWKLNTTNNGPYAPLSDAAWVKKVMDLAAKDIDKDKLVMGIPTYGHEYEITVSPTGGYTYKKLWSLNPKYTKEIQKKFKATPARTSYGEMSLAYIPKDSEAYKAKVKVASGIPKADMPLALATAHAKATGKPSTVNIMWWHDVGAIEQKVALADTLGIRGVGIFKIDGGADSKIWKILK